MSAVSLFALAERDTTLRKSASTGGGEWAGPCPFCGGHDRFRVQPNASKGERWYCRQCGEGKWHDVYDYVMKRDNVKFPQAKRMVDGEAQDWKPIKITAAVAPKPQLEYDPEVWRHRAEEYIKWCAVNLLDPMGDETSEWLHGRGITEAVCEMAKLGYNPKDIRDKPERWGFPKNHEPIYLSHGLQIPCWDSAGVHGIKIRRGEPDAHPKYISVKGSGVWMYGAWTLESQDQAYTSKRLIYHDYPSTGLLFESELDALTGLSTGYGMGYLALPAGQHMHEHFGYILKMVENVVIVPDNDEAGLAHAERLSIIPDFMAAPPAPEGKDLTEYYQRAGKDALLDYLILCCGVVPSKPVNLDEIINNIPLAE